MKRITTIIAGLMMAASAPFSANAQYYDLANQVTNMLSTALTAGASYKGYVEATYMKGFGENNGDFAGISTSQGVMFGPHFYMGAGVGVDAVMAHVDNSDWASGPMVNNPDKGVTKTGCVLPLFSDFRLIVGPTGGAQCQVGLQMGCSFLVSSSYIQVNRGYITSSECFYLKPSVGVRIPVSSKNAKQAVTISAAYQLITPNYRPYYGSDSAISLNSFGVNVGFEW